MNNLFAPLIKRDFWHGDCLELMKFIPDGSVDMILCDLPYGTTQNKWDSIIPFEPLWEQYWRVLKRNGAVVLTAAQPFTSALIMSQVEYYKYNWVWDKVNKFSGHLNAKKQPLRITEDICVFYKNQSTYNPTMTKGVPYVAVSKGNKSANFGKQKDEIRTINSGEYYPRNLISIEGDERGTAGRVHPTQKPVALFEYLIKTYTNPGETVLDNCAGSGTTAIAALNIGRGYICIERDDEYYRRATERVANHA
jgi:site-specific DNA-methyltransferase (adenine-specific)